jgi:hypothetical protein
MNQEHWGGLTAVGFSVLSILLPPELGLGVACLGGIVVWIVTEPRPERTQHGTKPEPGGPH